MMAAARMAFASWGHVHLLLPSSPSTPILARTRVGYGGTAKPAPLSLFTPSPPARSSRNSAPFFPCFSYSSNATGAPAHHSPAAEEKSPAPAPAAEEKEKGEVPVGELAGLLDIRVGRVVKAWQHPEADALYVEEVDVGEEQPRTICSGLVKFMPIEQLQDSNVIVLANLKPRNMRGIKSNGMLMCASDASHDTVELLTPPEGSVPGERVWFGSEDDKNLQAEPATANQVQKKKFWESVQPHLGTTDDCIAVLGEHPMRTSAGKVFCKSLKGANVS